RRGAGQQRGQQQRPRATAAAGHGAHHIVWVGFSAVRLPASRVSIRFLTASPSGVSENCTPTPAVRAPWAPVGVTQTTLPATGRPAGLASGGAGEGGGSGGRRAEAGCAEQRGTAGRLGPGLDMGRPSTTEPGTREERRAQDRGFGLRRTLHSNF